MAIRCRTAGPAQHGTDHDAIDRADEQQRHFPRPDGAVWQERRQQQTEQRQAQRRTGEDHDGRQRTGRAPRPALPLLKAFRDGRTA